MDDNEKSKRILREVAILHNLWKNPYSRQYEEESMSEIEEEHYDSLLEKFNSDSKSANTDENEIYYTRELSWKFMENFWNKHRDITRALQYVIELTLPDPDDKCGPYSFFESLHLEIIEKENQLKESDDDSLKLENKY